MRSAPRSLPRITYTPRAFCLRRHTHSGSESSTHDVPSAQTPLPSTFRSLYRLFLRAASASVLAHPKATADLRKLWRPVFDNAAKTIRQLEGERLPNDRHDVLTHWYLRWEERMDNTISLLYSSAVSRGLSHRVTQNMHRMVQANATLREPARPLKKPWRGQLPPDSPEYKPKPLKPLTPTQMEMREIFSTSPRLLGEVVGMAESWGGLSLGRTRRRR
ncbi:hypothetical protein C8Q77DRAFT_303951 [Trametes polyzona]|nr:hypothetical protein C8Q77DRAFT_303951 [Trametes polyzona]